MKSIPIAKINSVNPGRPRQKGTFFRLGLIDLSEKSEDTTGERVSTTINEANQ